MSLALADPVRAGLATAELLCDADLVTELVSDLLPGPVRATRLRHKPGLSTTASLVSESTGRPQGWVLVCGPGHRDKARNALRRATQRNLPLLMRQIPGGDALWLLAGPIDSDPRLQGGLDAVRPVVPSIEGASSNGQVQILRYNPMRRLVLARGMGAGRHTVRITSGKSQRPHRLTASLHAAGVPVSEPVEVTGIRDTKHVRVWPWVPGEDLARLSDPARAAAGADAAGRALARLHRAPVRPGRLREHGTVELQQRLKRLHHAMIQLEPAAGKRFGRLAVQVIDRLGELGEPGPALLHGDFSADQVVVQPDGQVRLLDLDRVGLGDPRLDLGSFAAAELLGTGGSRLTGLLLDGYRSAAGGGLPGEWGSPDGEQTLLAPHTAYALLCRADEPFRAGKPSWVHLVHRRLDQAVKVLDR